MQKTAAPVYLESPSAQRKKKLQYSETTGIQFKDLTPSLPALLPHAPDLHESTTSFITDNQSLQAGRKTTLMVTHRGEDTVVANSQTPEIAWRCSLVCPEPLPGMNIRSGMKNLSTKQNLNPKTDYVKDVLQPNSHIFKYKPHRPSSIISGKLSLCQKNNQNHKDSKSEVTNFQLPSHTYSLRRQKVKQLHCGRK